MIIVVYAFCPPLSYITSFEKTLSKVLQSCMHINKKVCRLIVIGWMQQYEWWDNIDREIEKSFEFVKLRQNVGKSWMMNYINRTYA